MENKKYRVSHKVLTKDDVVRAVRNTNSNRMAAKYLGINIITWKKWATQYVDDNGVSYYEKHNNKQGKGLKKFRANNRELVSDVLNGKIPAWWVKAQDIRDRLIVDGYLSEKCDRCGYCERRNLDLKIPLILHYRDHNKRNLKLENLQFLCYNCYFLAVGEVFDKAQLRTMELYSVNKCKKVDWDLPKEFGDMYDDSMTTANKEELESMKIEDYEATQPKQKKNKKEPPPIPSNAPEPTQEEDFGMDLVSYLKNR